MEMQCCSKSLSDVSLIGREVMAGHEKENTEFLHLSCHST